MIQTVFDFIGIPLLLGAALLLFWIESKRPLRRRKDRRWRRIWINLLLSAPSLLVLRFLFVPIIVWLAARSEALHFGLNHFYDLPPWLEAIVAILVLDYSNYLWHILNHKIPFLWRFHLVHHTDPDLDLATAFRFHFGEMIGSVFYRGAFTLLSGVPPLIVLIYEILFQTATMFHHSNTRLPFRMEKLLNYFVVTPRMHGIHHSTIRDETDSNYSVLFSLWDRVHATLRLDKPQDSIVIGVPAYAISEELTASFLFLMPLKQPRAWKKVGTKPSPHQKLTY